MLLQKSLPACSRKQARSKEIGKKPMTLIYKQTLKSDVYVCECAKEFASELSGLWTECKWICFFALLNTLCYVLEVVERYCEKRNWEAWNPGILESWNRRWGIKGQRERTKGSNKCNGVNVWQDLNFAFVAIVIVCRWRKRKKNFVVVGSWRLNVFRTPHCWWKEERWRVKPPHLKPHLL